MVNFSSDKIFVIGSESNSCSGSEKSLFMEDDTPKGDDTTPLVEYTPMDDGTPMVDYTPMDDGTPKDDDYCDDFDF